MKMAYQLMHYNALCEFYAVKFLLWWQWVRLITTCDEDITHTYIYRLVG